MWPIVKRFFHDLFYSAERATLWFRGVAIWISTTAGLVLTQSADVIASWHLRDWLVRWVIASAAAIAMMKKVGDKNPDPPLPPPS